MTRYKALAIVTKYWRPGDNYLRIISNGLRGKISNGDFIVISEKATSTATENILDESRINPGLMARLIAMIWMPLIWGRILGPICGFPTKALQHLKNYPVEMGGRHKQAVLKQAGLLEVLMFGSEAGIDGSNLAYSYVSLPLNQAKEIARRIHSQIKLTLGKEVTVMIIDTDKTYSFRNFHFTPRPRPIGKIHSFGGFLTYVIGQAFKLKKSPTPIALVGERLNIREVLKITCIANHVMGFGSGRTVWNMAGRFAVELDEVSWEMLETVKHKPIAIVRKI
ncbi:MAG: coenzyme F420-0:L-glutamate ligase [Candidatus Bathyarchaeota archaeon]|jgi:F420-0:gamma-glutamyl ligase-like protein